MPARTVAIEIHEGVMALDVAGPVDVFSDANALLPSEDQYRIALVGQHRSPLRASNGMQFMPDVSYAEANGGYALVLVAGGAADPGAARDEDRCAWLHQVVPTATLYGGICTGAFAFGHAGFLDGHVVTTHWLHGARLAALFPRAKVEPDRIYVRDGSLVTSAGVTAGIDLALAIVAEDHGPKLALSVAKRLVVVARRQGGQSQFSPYLTALADDSPFARIQAHVMEHLNSSLGTKELADIVGMSQRTLARIIAQDANVTPHEFVERARLDAARNLLEGSDRAMKAIAYDCGFGSANHLRAVFIKWLGVSPTQYRSSFQIRATAAGRRTAA